MSRPVRVVVIGAGIGGLAAACALRQHGIEVEVYERSSELGEVGAGLQLGPNAVKVLRALGIEDALSRLAFEPTNIVSVSWDDASLRYREPLKQITVSAFGARYRSFADQVMAHHADLHDVIIVGDPAQNTVQGFGIWENAAEAATLEDTEDFASLLADVEAHLAQPIQRTDLQLLYRLRPRP